MSTKPARRSRFPLHLSRAALSGLVRGAATAVGTVVAGWFLAWLRTHL
jgi:hypothetical protein